jgi:prepilin-type N-terminal cleavage/methylation domain-containing protein
MRTTHRGYTLVEMVMALTVAATAAAMAIPQVSRTVSHTRVNSAAALIVGQMERSVALAARQRKPVRITINSATKTVAVIDRATGTVLSSDKFSLTSEYHLNTLTGSPAQIDIYPNGTLSGSLTLTLGIADYSRQVTVSRAGQVRLLAPQSP